MNKSYYFLAGLHRSGNTLLSAILNQNPEIYVSPLSPLVEFMWQCHSSMDESIIINPKKENVDYLISKMIENYYHDTEKPIIFDRSKAWLNPYNVEMIKKYINPDPKIIFTIRPLRECIASTIKIQKNQKLLKMAAVDYKQDETLSENDNLAEFLLSRNQYAILNDAYNSYIDEENLDNIHLVKYEDLVNNTEDTLKKIYNFIGIKDFDHDLNNIVRVEKELDDLIGTPNLHAVEKQIKPSNINPLDYMSQKMVDKCNEMDLFYQ
jgi:sulfotransferase